MLSSATGKTLSDSGWVEEHRFHETRRWRFDFAHPASKVAVEIEGGIFIAGRHTRGAGFVGDCEKLNTAQLMGWIIYRIPTTLKDADMQMWAQSIALFAEARAL
jgi:hypothetical protein